MAGNSRLGETDEAYQDRIASEWRTFFEEEVGSLISTMSLCAQFSSQQRYGNTEKGYAAEAHLREILKER